MSKVAIAVEGVSKGFKLPHERHSGLKQAIINFRLGGTYELQRVLKNVSFNINEGDFFGIVGRNGSGKSTLLKLIAQIYTPDEGSVIINGTLTPFIELGVGFNPELTGRENVFLNGALLGFNRKQIEGMYEDIVDFAEIPQFMDQKLKNYSSGMQVRLAFSIAIRAESDILLLDEVLAVGDAGFQQKCYNYFEELKRQRKTVVFVSHDMAAVKRFCGRAVYLKNGEIVCHGTPEDVADAYALDILENSKLETDPNFGTSKDYMLRSKIISQDSEKLSLEFSYSSTNEEALYIGISISKDGLSIAELTTPLNDPLKGNGKMLYVLSTSILNGGSYQIGAGLFKLKGRELIATPKTRCQFVIKGSDIMRGSYIKLSDTWKKL